MIKPKNKWLWLGYVGVTWITSGVGMLIAFLQPKDILTQSTFFIILGIGMVAITWPKIYGFFYEDGVTK
jgi:hypothetical protein